MSNLAEHEIEQARLTEENEQAEREQKWYLVKRKPVIHKFNALAVFLPLLINGDGGGLSFKDGMALDKYCEANKYLLTHGHFSYESEPDTWFGICDVTGVAGELTEIHFVQMTEFESQS